MWSSLLLVAFGVTLVVAGANFLTDGASAIARRFRIPQLIIGLTIVSFGTSAPELAVSVISSLGGNGGIAVGNVIGSNIFNVLFILGICAVISPLPIHLNTVRYDLPIALLSAILLMIVLSDLPLDGVESSISRSESLMLLLFGLLFLGYTFLMGKKGSPEEPDEATPQMPQHWLMSVLLVLGGLAGLVFGGQLFVDNASSIARSLGVSDTLIGLTLVSWGTSLPELATSVVAAIKKNTGIAVGNAIGSNIFNILFVLGITGTVHPLQQLEFTSLDVWMQLIAIVVALGVALFWGKREIKRAEGIIMLLIFIGYNAVLISNAMA